MFKISKQVTLALKLLEEKGYEAYIVGGAVRNAFLGIKINDYDITTNASPSVIKMIFRAYPQYDIGSKMGTIVVTIDKVKIDITTYRSDDVYVDHRHPTTVIFSDNLEEDLKRRDFTINALCLDSKNNLIDKYNGLDDLNKKIIRAIGNPHTRFHEDALRILRALSFSSRLNFRIEKKTKEAMFECKDLLNYISNERKKDELLKILSSNNISKTINTYLDIFNTFIPFKTVDKTVDTFNNPYFALSYLLTKTNNYDLKELKFSTKEINLIKALVEASNINIRKDYDFISLLSDPLQKEILDYISQLYSKDYNQRYKKLKKYMVNVNELKINGYDLINMNYEAKEIGIIQKQLVEQIRQKKLNNTKTALIKYLSSK